jgi:hypothetical protein
MTPLHVILIEHKERRYYSSSQPYSNRLKLSPGWSLTCPTVRPVQAPRRLSGPPTMPLPSRPTPIHCTRESSLMTFDITSLQSYSTICPQDSLHPCIIGRTASFALECLIAAGCALILQNAAERFKWGELVCGLERHAFMCCCAVVYYVRPTLVFILLLGDMSMRLRLVFNISTLMSIVHSRGRDREEKGALLGFFTAGANVLIC